MKFCKNHHIAFYCTRKWSHSALIIKTHRSCSCCPIYLQPLRTIRSQPGFRAASTLPIRKFHWGFTTSTCRERQKWGKAPIFETKPPQVWWIWDLFGYETMQFQGSRMLSHSCFDQSCHLGWNPNLEESSSITATSLWLNSPTQISVTPCINHGKIQTGWTVEFHPPGSPYPPATIAFHRRWNQLGP